MTKRTETVYEEVDDWEEVIVPPPKLTESHIAQLTDSGRFERGREYWRETWRLENLQRDGWTLMGNCLGKVGKGRRSYQVSATLNANGVTGQKCTCPDFYGRRLCKHLVALLLAWVHTPQRFKVVGEKKERRPVKRQVPRRVERQHIVLVDFGIAKVMEEVDPNRPRSSSLIAWTDGYSPPEQYESGVEVDDRADQYALAATMVFALTGVTPEDTFTRMEKFRKGESTLPLKPNEVPESVRKAIEVAMRFKPSQRFPSVTEFWKSACGLKPLPKDIEPSVTAGKKAKEGVKEDIIILIRFVTMGAIFNAITGAVVGAIEGASIRDAIWGAIWGAILTIVAAIFYAIIVAVKDGIEGASIRDAIEGAIEGAFVGAFLAIIMAGFLAIMAAIYGISEIIRR